MSSSDSHSASVSSSEAIIAHFDEAAGVLSEGGYRVPSQAWASITQAISDGVIKSISFWGVDSENEGDALLRLNIDWSRHEVTVTNGDAVSLTMRDGKIHLVQVRKSAQGFLRGFHMKGLRAAIRLAYTPDAAKSARSLNMKYGWRDAPEMKKKNVGSGWSVESRYHAAVDIEVWFGD